MIPDDLAQAIEAKDISLVKAIILLQINSDRMKEELLALKWADQANQILSNLDINLYQDDNGESHYTEDRALWNKNLWGELRIDFEYNFSRHKLEQINQLMNHLRSQGHPDFQIDESFNDGRSAAPKLDLKREESEHNSGTSKMHNNRNYYIGCGAGAILGGVGGKLLGFGVAGVVVGVAVGMAVVYFKNNRG